MNGLGMRLSWVGGWEQDYDPLHYLTGCDVEHYET